MVKKMKVLDQYKFNCLISAYSSGASTSIVMIKSDLLIVLSKNNQPVRVSLLVSRRCDVDDSISPSMILVMIASFLNSVFYILRNYFDVLKWLFFIYIVHFRGKDDDDQPLSHRISFQRNHSLYGQ